MKTKITKSTKTAAQKAAPVKEKRPLYWEAKVTVSIPSRVKDRDKLVRIANQYGFLCDVSQYEAVFLFPSAVEGRASEVLEEFCNQLAHHKLEILRYRHAAIQMDSNTFDVLQVMAEDLYEDH